MTKWMILNLGVTLPSFEANGFPKWVDDGAFPLGEVVPEGKLEGRVMVYVANSELQEDAGYTYIGALYEPYVDVEAKAICFPGWTTFTPVVTGLAGDDSPANAERVPKAKFRYLTEGAGERVLREGYRRTFRLADGLVDTLPGFAAEHGRTEDQVVEEALLDYFEKNGWEVY